MGQVKAVDKSVKNPQQKLLELANSFTKHDDELGVVFNSFSIFQSCLQKSIYNVTESIHMIEASNLGGTEMVTVLPEQLILERKV